MHHGAIKSLEEEFEQILANHPAVKGVSKHRKSMMLLSAVGAVVELIAPRCKSCEGNGHDSLDERQAKLIWEAARAMLTPETFQEIERRALEITTELDVKLGPYRAEIVRCGNLDDAISEARWHVAATVPARQHKAIKFLSDRGFGVYAPAFEVTHIHRRRKVTRYRPLFPGHLFLFVWDIKRHWRRIRACPGIARILSIEEEPVVVPYDAIHRMQAIEYSGIDALKPKRRNWRKKKGRLVEVGGDNIISISPKSYWHNITNLDDTGRNQLLHKALGLVPHNVDPTH